MAIKDFVANYLAAGVSGRNEHVNALLPDSKSNIAKWHNLLYEWMSYVFNTFPRAQVQQSVPTGAIELGLLADFSTDKKLHLQFM